MKSGLVARTSRLLAAGMVAGGLMVVAPLGAAEAPAVGPDAKAMMAEAKSRAAQEHKGILLVFSASWCGPCHMFERFLNDPQMKPIMDKAFVIGRLDVGEVPTDSKHADTPGAVELRSSLGGGEAGYPYLVMLDAAGKPLADSLRPAKGHKENIGYPDSAEEIDWFTQMLQRSATNLSPAEIASAKAWLQAHSSERQH